ncbi:NHS-like protein 3 isoform X2 [Paramisgurnus dabryanus]|uniref:NHS-like protein 3 isoform X2 n=1 Tax=Paramisgurnus dabryanus TaxID=90735 RepID=UPI0031F37740
MSRRSSAGDLVPKDITEILALQASLKKRGSSLGRAFSWFKGSKRKRSLSNGQSRTGGPCGRNGESTATNQIHDSGEPCKGQKQDDQKKLSVHYTASQHHQDNVFIEGCRPQYLEDLHTEAREGLKILQQEEHRNGLDFQDDQSLPEDASSRDRDESLETNSTAGNSIISASSASAVSSRPVLTRQGSTFKPLNPVKRLDRTKRRSRRTTIMGIPQQVQKELDMARGTIQQLPNGGQFSEDDSSGRIVIPTIDGEPPSGHHEGARVHLQNIEALQTSRDEELLIQHIQSVYQDDMSVSRKLGKPICPLQRPKSLAVPGMITSTLLQEPQGPVMSISPQATYLSKIIPNAVLPAAIDIIEINHGPCQHSVSAISKGSSTASPASSRSGGRRSEGPNSTSRTRSHSRSSETVVSNSSTISSRENGSPVCVADNTKEVLNVDPKDIRATSSNSNISTKQRVEHKASSDAEENIRSSSPCSRSLSVMKTKLPPAPPQRTYSLHHEKLKRRSKDCVNGKDFKDMAPNNRQNLSKGLESSLKSSPVSPDQAFTGCQAASSSSSPQKITSSESKFDRTLSPSSGYSSQSGTPTHSPKEVSPSSPGNRSAKPSRCTGVQTSPVVSVSSSMTSLSSVTSDTTHHDMQTNTTPSEPLKLFPPVIIAQNKSTSPQQTITLRDRFNIPPPPKVKAPSPPPPETWIHNKHTFELLCGPGPNLCRLHQLQKQQKETFTGDTPNTDLRHNVTQIIPEIQTSEETSVVSQLETKEFVLEEQNETVLQQVHEQIMAERPATRSTLHNEPSKQEDPEIHGKASKNVQTKDQRNVEDQKEQGIQTNPNKKVPTIEVDQPNSKVNTSTAKCYKTEAENQRDCTVKDISNRKSMQTLSIEVHEVSGISPPSSPPPAHHPPPPPTKQLSSSRVSILAPDEEKHRQETEVEFASLESSWPPPPPPIDGSADLIFEDQYEPEFPPPPPSFIHEPLSDNGLEESCEEKINSVCDTGSGLEKTITILPKRTLLNSTVMEVRQYDKPKSCTNILQLPVDQADSSEKSIHSQDEHQPKPTTSAQDSSEQASPDLQAESNIVPLAPPLPVEDLSTVNIIRQPNPVNKDDRSKELLCRHKNTPVPKEDANIPLVTPSLLQMVRLRAVNLEDQVNDDSRTGTEDTTKKDQQIANNTTPQKPIRKSLTLKSNQLTTSTTVTAPSMCLQEAIRMKTAALSSGGVPAMLNSRSTASTGLPLPKSPASTASFIFSKSTKKVILETPTSPGTQSEIIQISDQAKMMITNGTKKPIKVPPPVAKKPVHGLNPHNKPEITSRDKTESLTSEQIVRVNGDAVHPAGRCAQASMSPR